MLRKLILGLLAGSIALGASACNTVRGAGQDVESARARASLPDPGRAPTAIRVTPLSRRLSACGCP